MRRLIFLVFILFLGLHSNAQEDTIRLLQYNLLNYGNYTSYCTTANNNIDSKDEYLRTILDYVKPDVFTVIELGVNFVGLENEYGERILDSTLNIDGVTKYKKAMHTGGTYLVNMLYYNSEKLVLYNQEFISTDANGQSLIREIDFYTLYHNDPNLASHNDTVFITFVVAHLKAGSNQSDQDDRAAATLAVMGYIDNNYDRFPNIVICGDFNVKGDSESSYSNLLTYPNQDIRFYDPIDKPGYWAGDWQFKEIHTQSTHNSSSSGDCPAGGGLDDRFDFILATRPILWGQTGASYIPNTYKALGNDGSSYNSDLNTTTNTSVPPNVANALFNMSDHLPVTMDIRISKDIVNGIYQPKKQQMAIEYNNPIQENLIVRIPNNEKAKKIVLRDINGRIVYSKHNPEAGTQFVISTNRLNSGIYFLSVTNSENITGAYKVVKF